MQGKVIFSSHYFSYTHYNNPSHPCFYLFAVEHSRKRF